MTEPEKTDETPAKKPAKKAPAKKAPAKRKAPARKKPGTDLAVVPNLGNLVKVAQNAIVDPTRPEGRTWYPTGATAFDAVVANGHPNVIGGFPAGTVIDLHGEESTGKTTLALQAAANMQRQHGKLIVYLDYERSFDEDYAKALGLDTTPFMDAKGNYLGGLFWLVEPEHMEQGFQIMDDICRHEDLKNMIGMFILDSVAAQKSKHDKVTQTQDKGTAKQREAYEGFDRLGLVAAQMGRFLPTTQRLLKQTTGVLVLINQVRHNVDANSHEKWVTPGGKTIKHVAAIRILLTKADKIYGQVLDPLTGERKRGPIGHWVEFQIKKNKVTGEFYNRVRIPVVSNLGVYNVLSCVHIGKALKVVKVSGSHYTVPAEIAGAVEDVKGQGDLGLASVLMSSPQVAQNFVANVSTALYANFEVMRQEAVSGRTLSEASDADQDIIDVDAIEEVDEG